MWRHPGDSGRASSPGWPGRVDRAARPSHSRSYSVERREVVESGGDRDGSGQAPFQNRQRALIKRLGLRVVALIVVEQREVVEVGGDIRVIRTERLFINRQRALIERLGLRIVALLS